MPVPIAVWDVRTGRCTQTLAGHHGEISSTQFSYSSDLCISGSIDRTCKVRKARAKQRRLAEGWGGGMERKTGDFKREETVQNPYIQNPYNIVLKKLEQQHR